MAESGGRNTAGGRCLLCLFTCHFPAHFASRPAHVESIDSPFTHSRMLFFFSSCSHFFIPSCCCHSASLPTSKFFFLRFNSPFYLILFLPACPTGWVCLPPCAAQSLAVLIYVTDFAALAVSASFSPSLFAIPLSGSFMLLLPCYTALSAVNASLSTSIFSLLLHPCSFLSFLGPCLRFLSFCISYRIQSSLCLSASLQRSS